MADLEGSIALILQPDTGQIPEPCILTICLSGDRSPSGFPQNSAQMKVRRQQFYRVTPLFPDSYFPKFLLNAPYLSIAYNLRYSDRISLLKFFLRKGNEIGDILLDICVTLLFIKVERSLVML
jgi:hypothetical protein